MVADQVNAANNSGLGLHSSALESLNFSDISVGKYNVIIGTPESWIQIKDGKTCFLTVFSHNLCCIVVDEVHKVSWGTSDVDKPFREIFSQLSIIRSVCRHPDRGLHFPVKPSAIVYYCIMKTPLRTPCPKAKKCFKLESAKGQRSRKARRTSGKDHFHFGEFVAVKGLIKCVN